MTIHPLNPDLVHRANYNSMGGTRGDSCNSDYMIYAERILIWPISDEKKQKLLDKLHVLCSEHLKYAAQHVSVAVAGPAKYNARKLDKSDKVLECSHRIVAWFDGIESQIKLSTKTDDKAARLEDMILFCDERQELNPTTNLTELAFVDNARFIELYEKLHPKYKWRKNSIIYKVYQQSIAGEIKEIKAKVFFEDDNFTAYDKGGRVFIKFIMKPQRQLQVALKSRGWWWNNREYAWSTYPDRADKEWVAGISERYSQYL